MQGPMGYVPGISPPTIPDTVRDECSSLSIQELVNLKYEEECRLNSEFEGRRNFSKKTHIGIAFAGAVGLASYNILSQSPSNFVNGSIVSYVLLNHFAAVTCNFLSGSLDKCKKRTIEKIIVERMQESMLAGPARLSA